MLVFLALVWDRLQKIGYKSIEGQTKIVFCELLTNLKKLSISILYFKYFVHEVINDNDH